MMIMAKIVKTTHHQYLYSTNGRRLSPTSLASCSFNAPPTSLARSMPALGMYSLRSQKSSITLRCLAVCSSVRYQFCRRLGFGTFCSGGWQWKI